MPGGDGTGPMGMGPMSGGARGYCRGAGFRAGYGAGLGRGVYRGYGNGAAGFGGRRWGYTPYPVEYAESGPGELEALKRQSADLENTLKDIQKRLQELGEE